MTIDARPPLVDGGDGAVLLRVRELAKAFGATQALRSCSFELRAGEVHALVGENGSGKSTLVKILSRRAPPGRGQIEVGGGEVRCATPAAPRMRPADRDGVPGGPRRRAAVGARQRLARRRRRLRARSHARREARAARARRSASCSARPATSTQPVERAVASATARRAASRARCVREPRILILDEATSALDVATRDRLFAIVSAAEPPAASASIFISHRMDEVEEIGDRITVMRSGETVATLDAREVDAARARAPDDRHRPAERRTAIRGRRASAPARRSLRAHGVRAAPRRRRRSTSSPRRRARRARRARGPRPGRVPARRSAAPRPLGGRGRLRSRR